jgi:glucose/arabinose dehydrogenase
MPKNLIANRDGSRLYVTVGSNSNAAENGLDKEERRAAILEVDPATGQTRVFASGLRNPNGMAWEPDTGVLWTVVNERDELGSDLVPDYLASVTEGGFYGWPLLWSARGSSSHPAEARLGGQSDQTRVRPRQPYSFAWTRILYGHYFAGAIQTWRFHRPTRVMEPHTS